MEEALLTGAGLFFIRPELSGSCVLVFEDKHGAIALAEKPPCPACSKNIDVQRFNFIRDYFVQRRSICSL